MYAFGTPVASISQCVATEAANSRHSNYVQSVCSALIARMSRRGWGGWGGRGWGVWGAEMMWCPGGKSVTGRAPLTPAVGAHVWPCAETHAVARKHSHRWKARSPEYLLTPWDLPIRAWCHQRMLERADGIFPYIPLATTLPSVQPNDPSPFTPSRGDGGGLLRRDITALQPLKHQAYLLMRRDKQTEADSVQKSVYSSGKHYSTRYLTCTA